MKISFIGLIELALMVFFLFHFLRDRDSGLAGRGALLPLVPTAGSAAPATIDRTT